MQQAWASCLGTGSFFQLTVVKLLYEGQIISGVHLTRFHKEALGRYKFNFIRALWSGISTDTSHKSFVEHSMDKSFSLFTKLQGAWIEFDLTQGMSPT